MIRKVLKDSQWERIAPLLPGKPGDPGRPAADNRLFLEAVLWIAHGRTLARSSRPIRALKFCLPPLPPLEFEGGVREFLRGLIR